MPGLELGLRFGGFGFGLTMSAMVVTLDGPDGNKKELRPAENPDCDANPTQLACRIGGSKLVDEERAYGPFVALLPGLYAGYAF